MDEEPAVLAANIISILHNTPPVLLQRYVPTKILLPAPSHFRAITSIIVVDDAGDRIPVPQNLTQFDKVQLVRIPEAAGVAGARIAGAAQVMA